MGALPGSCFTSLCQGACCAGRRTTKHCNLRSNSGSAAGQECGLTLPSRGRHKGRFAPFVPPLMSNVSPQQMPQVHRASGASASKAPSRAKPSRAHGQAVARSKSCTLVTIEMRRAIRVCCGASKEEHGAEAPRKSKLRSSIAAKPTHGHARQFATHAVHEFTREFRSRGVTLRRR